jgi:hypothetical protein
MKGKTATNALYYFFTACIVVGAIFVYKAWWDRYFRLRPELAVAEPTVLSLDIPFEGVLIWEEVLLTSPIEGTVSFPQGKGPAYCAKGEVIAQVTSSAGKRQVKTPSPGYFMAALDGAEGNWSYGALWPGSSRLPQPGSLRYLDEGHRTSEGTSIGKFIPQPQSLRCVAYVEKSALGWNPSERDYIDVKRSAVDLPFRAEVRAVNDLGPIYKVYLTFPFFSSEEVFSRRISYLIHAGDARGVIIPESAVILRDRKKMVFLVTGDRSVAVEVNGMPVSGRRFLVEKGLEPGDLVIASAAEVDEGEVRIW